MFSLISSTGTVIDPAVTSALHNTLLNSLALLLNILVAGALWALKTWIASMNSGWKRAVAERLVKYAEQRIVGDQIKRDYVAKELSNHFPRLSQDEVSHLIEEAVVNLKTQLDAPSTPNPEVTK